MTNDEKASELRTAYDDAVAREGAELPGPFTTVSGRPIERLYDATDVEDIDYERDINHIEPVGSYAIQLNFSDGHNTGLFS